MLNLRSLAVNLPKCKLEADAARNTGRREGDSADPRLEFPFIYCAILRWRAKRLQYLCPVCDKPMEAIPTS